MKRAASISSHVELAPCACNMANILNNYSVQRIKVSKWSYAFDTRVSGHNEHDVLQSLRRFPSKLVELFIFVRNAFLKCLNDRNQSVVGSYVVRIEATVLVQRHYVSFNVRTEDLIELGAVALIQ